MFFLSSEKKKKKAVGKASKQNAMLKFSNLSEMHLFALTDISELLKASVTSGMNNGTE